MGKPVDKTEKRFLENFARLDEFKGIDEKFKREEKRVWKKARTKYLRNKSKVDLRKETDGIED